MISSLRQSYNTNFTEKKYRAFLEEIYREAGSKASFNIAETPIFIPKSLKNRIIKACEEISDSICHPNFKQQSHDGRREKMLTICNI